MRFPALSLAAALAFPAGIAFAAEPSDEWPQWRGPNRDGTVSAATLKRLPKEWPAAAPAASWKSFVGEGYSSPVISDGKVFIMGRDADGNETCLCFDANSGSPLWKHKYATAYIPPDLRAGSGPKSTPTVDRDRVYMLGLGGMFSCLDTRTGRLLWSRDFQKEAWGVEKDEEGVDKWFPPCGNAASPIVDGSQVIVPVGGKKMGAMAAFDRDTGKLLWHAVPERSSYGSPMISSLAGRKQIVGFSGLRMVGLDLGNRETLWELPFPAHMEQTITTPVLYKDLVIVSGEVKPTVALRISKDGGKITQTQAWQNPELRAYMTSPVLAGDFVVGADQASKRLICIDAATGVTKWTSPRIPGYVSMVVAGDKILALTSPGELVVFAADSKEYRELARWKVSTAGDAWSYLGLAGGKIYVKDKTELICYDLGAKSGA